jgi:hypothetical protein
MSFRLLDSEREELEQLVFELETSRLPVRRHAAELLLLRKVVRAVRDLERLPPRVRDLLSRIPRLSDKHAWDVLSSAEKVQAAEDQLVEEAKQQ